MENGENWWNMMKQDEKCWKKMKMIYMIYMIKMIELTWIDSNNSIDFNDLNAWN